MKRQTCRFCNQEYKVRFRRNATHYTGKLINLRYIDCPICQVNSYFNEDMDPIKLVYRFNHETFKYLSMNIAANHTSMIFQDEKRKPIQFDGVWPQTKPDQAIRLAERLIKLVAFL